MSKLAGAVGTVLGFILGFVLGIVFFEGGPGFEPMVLVCGAAGAALGIACALAAARRRPSNNDPRQGVMRGSGR